MSETWESYKLGAVADVLMGQSPDSSFYNNEELGYPFLQGSAEFGFKFPTAIQFCSEPTRVAKSGSILISVRAPVGDVNRADRSYCIGRGLAEIREKSVNIDFLYHAIQQRKAKLKQLSQGSTFEAINSKDLKSLIIEIPESKSVQKRIAAILETTDNILEETQALIQKYQSMKQGLMHDLFSRGVLENGELRPIYAEAPELYEERKELGFIPREWEVIKLKELLERFNGSVQTGPFGSQLHAHEYVESGVPVIMPQDINAGKISQQKIAQISPERANDLKRHKVVLGDVIFSRRGDLSRCAAIEEKEVGWLCGTGCLLVRFHANFLLAQWLSYLYQFDYCQRQVIANAIGSTMQNLNTQILNNLVLIVPSSCEQQRIIDRISSFEQQIQLEQDYLEKMRLLKQGLMQDLLTGRVF